MSDPNLPSLRNVAEDEYLLRRRINECSFFDITGISRDASHDSARPQLKVKFTDPALHFDSKVIDTKDEITLSTQFGKLSLTNSSSVFSLLTGVPMPAGGESKILFIFREICLARLGQNILSEMAPLEITSASDQRELISMTLVAERGDISTLSIARAPLQFWRALSRHSTIAPTKRPKRRKAWALNIPLQVAQGRFPISSLSMLNVGHLVHFEHMRLQPNGYGAAYTGTFTLEFNLDVEENHYLLRIESIRPYQARQGICKMDQPLMSDVNEKNDLPQNDELGVTNLVDDGASNSAFEQGGAQHFVDTRSIAVDIIAELGRLRTTIGELEQLQPGSIIKIAFDKSRQVELKIAGNGIASDQLVAVGELVQVGHSLAVQITRVQE